MARRMALPKIGVNMTEAVITKWLVKAGDHIQEGDAVLEAETDKSVQEIYATESGVITELLFQEGETVKCYEDFIVLAGGGQQDGAASKASEDVVKTAIPRPAAQTAYTPPSMGGRIRISPLAKKIAAEHRIDIGMLLPSKPGTRNIPERTC